METLDPLKIKKKTTCEIKICEMRANILYTVSSIFCTTCAMRTFKGNSKTDIYASDVWVALLLLVSERSVWYSIKFGEIVSLSKNGM